MADIAAAAGVSRQTLYDLFGGKDELIRASIRSITNHNLAEAQARMEPLTALADKLDAYFAETVVKSFELLQEAGDPEDLISGHNEAGKDEIARSHRRHEALVAACLAPFSDPIEATGQTVQSMAHFIVSVAMSLKDRKSDRDDLLAVLDTLKTAIMAVTHPA